MCESLTSAPGLPHSSRLAPGPSPLGLVPTLAFVILLRFQSGRTTTLKLCVSLSSSYGYLNSTYPIQYFHIPILKHIPSFTSFPHSLSSLSWSRCYSGHHSVSWDSRKTFLGISGMRRSRLDAHDGFTGTTCSTVKYVGSPKPNYSGNCSSSPF